MAQAISIRRIAAYGIEVCGRDSNWRARFSREPNGERDVHSVRAAHPNSRSTRRAANGQAAGRDIRHLQNLPEKPARQRSVRPCVVPGDERCAVRAGCRSQAGALPWKLCRSVRRGARFACEATASFVRADGIDDRGSRRRCAGLPVGRCRTCWRVDAAGGIEVEHIGDFAKKTGFGLTPRAGWIGSQPIFESVNE